MKSNSDGHSRFIIVNEGVFPPCMFELVERREKISMIVVDHLYILINKIDTSIACVTPMNEDRALIPAAPSTASFIDFVQTLKNRVCLRAFKVVLDITFHLVRRWFALECHRNECPTSGLEKTVDSPHPTECHGHQHERASRHHQLARHCSETRPLSRAIWV